MTDYILIFEALNVHGQTFQGKQVFEGLNSYYVDWNAHHLDPLTHMMDYIGQISSPNNIQISNICVYNINDIPLDDQFLQK
jgi:hypothetical protein